MLPSMPVISVRKTDITREMCSGAHFPGGTHITVRPGPQFPDILGTPGSPNSYDIRDPYMKKGRNSSTTRSTIQTPCMHSQDWRQSLNKFEPKTSNGGQAWQALDKSIYHQWRPGKEKVLTENVCRKYPETNYPLCSPEVLSWLKWPVRRASSTCWPFRLQTSPIFIE